MAPIIDHGVVEQAARCDGGRVRVFATEFEAVPRLRVTG